MTSEKPYKQEASGKMASGDCAARRGSTTARTPT